MSVYKNLPNVNVGEALDIFFEQIKKQLMKDMVVGSVNGLNVLNVYDELCHAQKDNSYIKDLIVDKAFWDEFKKTPVKNKEYGIKTVFRKYCLYQRITETEKKAKAKSDFLFALYNYANVDMIRSGEMNQHLFKILNKQR